MKKVLLAAAVSAVGLSAPAYAYDSPLLVENVTFHWATDGLARGWTSSADNALGAMTNNTYFSTLGGNNSTTYYNSDFAIPGNTAQGGCLNPAPGFVYQAQYACRVGNTKPVPTDAEGDLGPGAKATGQLTVTGTSLTGTLTVIDTNDEGAGPQPGTTAATGYNVRSADGSPFKNVWYGVSNQMTLTVNLAGTFNATNWEINGGTVAFADPAFQCGFADFGGVLCNPSTTAGGFTANGSFLSWGMDQGSAAGSLATEIQVFSETNGVPGALLTTLSGVLASLTVDASGNITTVAGETRTATGSSGGGCVRSLRYGTNATVTGDPGISCGTLAVRKLDISGTVVPVPAAAWLFGSALGLLGVARRKLAA